MQSTRLAIVRYINPFIMEKELSISFQSPYPQLNVRLACHSKFVEEVRGGGRTRPMDQEASEKEILLHCVGSEDTFLDYGEINLRCTQRFFLMCSEASSEIQSEERDVADEGVRRPVSRNCLFPSQSA